MVMKCSVSALARLVDSVALTIIGHGFSKEFYHPNEVFGVVDRNECQINVLTARGLPCLYMGLFRLKHDITDFYAMMKFNVFILSLSFIIHTFCVRFVHDLAKLCVCTCQFKHSLVACVIRTRTGSIMYSDNLLIF